mgnify:CR=1 FL=1
MEDQERIIKVDIEHEMRQSYINYSMSVIVARALPDVRDGFKPVHRRILFGMKEMGNLHSRPYKKCARIVGEVLGKYHPHGDSSVYFALVRMAQEWSMRYTLVDGQGNFGSVDGDSPAAMRYTEARLSLIGEAMMDDLEKETVDMTNNFDDTLLEPTVMPTRLPNLLLNGATGIAVGMATNIPTHNLGEVIDACVAFVDDPDMDVQGLMQYVKGPDFPTGGLCIRARHLSRFRHETVVSRRCRPRDPHPWQARCERGLRPRLWLRQAITYYSRSHTPCRSLHPTLYANATDTPWTTN